MTTELKMIKNYLSSSVQVPDKNWQKKHSLKIQTLTVTLNYLLTALQNHKYSYANSLNAVEADIHFDKIDVQNNELMLVDQDKMQPALIWIYQNDLHVYNVLVGTKLFKFLDYMLKQQKITKKHSFDDVILKLHIVRKHQY